MINAVQICLRRHLPCFAYILNLIVQNAFENDEIKVTITKVKGKKYKYYRLELPFIGLVITILIIISSDTVEYFKRPSSGLPKLKWTKRQMKLPTSN